MDLLKTARFHRLAGYAAAAQTDIVCTSEIDTTGYDYATIVAIFGTVTDNSELKLIPRTGDATGALSALTAPIAEAVASTSSSKMLVIELRRTDKRYISATIERKAANAALDACLLILHDGHYAPPTDTEAAEVLASAQG
jgi:hypothetical protein